MSPEGKILLWWVLFGGTHILGSSQPVRTHLIRWITLPGFKGLYSVVALATFIPLCLVYFSDIHAGALLLFKSPALNLVSQGLMLLSLVVLGQGIATESPMGTRAEMTGDPGPGATGILRITRHPQNLAFGLFGFAHCLANPFVGDWVFFGGFAVYGAASALHQDRRMRATGPDAARDYLAETSMIPFAAVLAGRQRLAFSEFRWAALLVSVGGFILLRVFHATWFGGFGG